MPRYIIKPDSDEDFYVLWSSIVEAPLGWGTRKELTADWAQMEPARFERADEHGTSLIPEDFWIDRLDSEDGEIYEQRGWLRYSRMKEVCQILSESQIPDGGDPRILALLDPLDDDEDSANVT